MLDISHLLVVESMHGIHYLHALFYLSLFHVSSLNLNGVTSENI